MTFHHAAAAAALLALPVAAQAQTPPPVTVSGSATIASDYRFRGVSQSDREMAVQGGITLTHDSGLYAPPQQAIGTWYDTGAAAAAGRYDHPGARDDNLYLWGDGALAIAGTSITGKVHIGHSRGQDGLGPNATALSPTGRYWDWSLGADASFRNLTLNVSYVDTDITDRRAAYLRPSFSRGQDGTGTIAGGTLVASLTAAL